MIFPLICKINFPCGPINTIRQRGFRLISDSNFFPKPVFDHYTACERQDCHWISFAHLIDTVEVHTTHVYYSLHETLDHYEACYFVSKT